ncbi:MAG: PD40 domain-containing protein [Myxococcales bacterium]|nr:PD40 domain-containing protein [Myxococcales bacterium]
MLSLFRPLPKFFCTSLFASTLALATSFSFAGPPTSRPTKHHHGMHTKQQPIPAPPKGYTPPKARQLTFAGVNGESYFSPDGKKLIFQSYGRKEHAHSQIYILDLQTGKETRINHHDGDDTCSYFHPNGKSILYASTVDEVKESHRFRFFAPSWVAKHRAMRNPTAQKQRWGKKTRSKHRRKYKWTYKPYEIYIADLDGKNRHRLTHANGYDAEGTYGPKGRFVIFSSHRDKDQELYLMNADGTHQRRLTWRKGNDGGPFLSPSGKAVTWRSFDKRGNAQIFVAQLQDGQLTAIRQLTFRPGIHWAPFWHPSEKWILFSANSDDRKNFELYLVNTEGTCLKRLTYSPAQDVLPVFSPDGKHIAFTSRKGRFSQLYLMPFVMPSTCQDPRTYRTPESVLHFPAPPKKRH